MFSFPGIELFVCICIINFLDAITMVKDPAVTESQVAPLSSREAPHQGGRTHLPPVLAWLGNHRPVSAETRQRGRIVKRVF